MHDFIWSTLYSVHCTHYTTYVIYNLTFISIIPIDIFPYSIFLIKVEEGLQHIEMKVDLYELEEDKRAAESAESDSECSDVVIVNTPPVPRKNMIVDMDIGR